MSAGQRQSGTERPENKQISVFTVLTQQCFGYESYFFESIQTWFYS